MESAVSPPPRVVRFNQRNNLSLLSLIYTSKATSGDVNIVCDDGVVGTHRVVLANLSEVLCKVINMDSTCLVLPGVRKVEVEALLSLAYIGECSVNSTTQGQLSTLMKTLSMSENCVSSEVKLEEEVTSVDMSKYFCNYCGAAYRRQKRMRTHQGICEEQAVKVGTCKFSLLPASAVTLTQCIVLWSWNHLTLALN